MKSLLPFICILAVGVFVVGNIISVYDAPSTCPCGDACDCGEGTSCVCHSVPANEVSYVVSSVPSPPEKVPEAPKEAEVIDVPCFEYHLGDTKHYEATATTGAGKYVVEWKWYPEKSVVAPKAIAPQSTTQYSNSNCEDGNCSTFSRPRIFRRR